MDRMDKGNNVERFSIKKRLKSFSHAFNGLLILLKYEHNFRIHLVILVLVLIAGFILKITPAQWLAIICVAALVLVTESLNSVLEYLSDQITGEYSDNIRRAKDVAAAAVLIASIASVIVGLIIFLPALFNFLKV